MDKTKFAFPVSYNFPGEEGVNEGMTIREYFAAKAMQAMIQSPSFNTVEDYREEETPELYMKRQCKVAVYIVDAMLEELDKIHEADKPVKEEGFD